VLWDFIFFLLFAYNRGVALKPSPNFTTLVKERQAPTTHEFDATFIPLSKTEARSPGCGDDQLPPRAAGRAAAIAAWNARRMRSRCIPKKISSGSSDSNRAAAHAEIRLVSRLADFPGLLKNTPGAEFHSMPVDRPHDEFVAAGHNGAILRAPDESYAMGARSVALPMYKRFDDAEFEIVGATSASRTDTGCVVWKCATESGQPFQVVPAWPDDERRDALANAGSFIGRMRTVTFFAGARWPACRAAPSESQYMQRRAPGGCSG
jgi:hypothetical protein